MRTRTGQTRCFSAAKHMLQIFDFPLGHRVLNLAFNSSTIEKQNQFLHTSSKAGRRRVAVGNLFVAAAAAAGEWIFARESAISCRDVGLNSHKKE